MVEGGEAIAHVVKGLQETVVSVERGFNDRVAAALRETAACNAELHTAHIRGILSVFLTYIGPCTLAPVAIFVLIVCSSGSAAPGRLWLFVSKALVLTAYASWVIPHVIDPHPQSLPAHSSLPPIWAETLREHVYNHLSPDLLPYFPRTPAPFFIIGTCAFALALAVQGMPRPPSSKSHVSSIVHPTPFLLQAASLSNGLPLLSSWTR